VIHPVSILKYKREALTGGVGLECRVSDVLELARLWIGNKEWPASIDDVRTGLTIERNARSLQ
jgi:hypothetical protein